MKILFCLNSLGGFGGIECVTITKANALSEIPDNEVAICYTDKGAYPRTIHPLSEKVSAYDLGTPYWNFTSPKEFIRKFIPTVFSTRKALIGLIKDLKPDIVVTTGSYEKFALAILSENKLRKIAGKKVVKIREYHFASNYRRFLGNSLKRKISASLIELFERQILSRCFSRSYLLTKADRKNFGRSLRFDYMYNPCRFNGTGPEADRQNVVLAVGRLCQQKNFPELVRIWAKVSPQAPDWKLRIVGSGHHEEMKIRSLIDELGLQSSVELPGRSEKVDQEMAKASIYAMTSLYEGCALVLSEAQYFRLPIVSYRVPYGADEIVRDGIDGYIVENGDREMFANRLLELIADVQKRKIMGDEAKAHAADFSVDNIVSEWMVKYNELLKN